MFKSTLLMSLLRQSFCLVVVGILFVGQLPDGSHLSASSSVVKLHSCVFDASTFDSFIGAVEIDDSADFLPAAIPGVSLSTVVELPLSYSPAPLLLYAAGVSSPPLARPPPVVFTC